MIHHPISCLILKIWKRSNHWSILLEDPHLKTTLATQPKVAYGKAHNIKRKIAPSKIKPTQPTSVPLVLIPLVGMYQCKKPFCLTCEFVQHVQKTFSVKGKTYTLKDFFNCFTDYIVYCLTCTCGLFYVGKTIRARFSEQSRKVEITVFPNISCFITINLQWVSRL